MAVVNLNLRHQSENLLVLSHAVDIRDTGRGEKGGLGSHAHTLNMERDEQLLTVQNSAYFDQFPSLILQQTACYSHSEREGGKRMD